MKNELIIFDCFGVIFGEIAPRLFRKYFDEETAAILKEKYFVAVDLGEKTLDETFDSLSKEAGISKEQIIEDWKSFIKLNEEIVPAIEKLKEEYTIILLSNAGYGFVEKLMKEFNLERLFDKMFISCNLKMAKPDPAIYLHCVNSFENKFDKIYMVDDSIKNLEHLPEIGITPVHFTSVEKMLSEIR